MSSIIRADKWQNSNGDAYNAVLQVVSTTKTDTFTTTSSSYVDVTGLSVSITPRFSNSKILVISSVQGGGQSGISLGYFQLVRDSSAIAIGDASGTKIRASSYVLSPGNNEGLMSSTITFLDSPNTTASVTYKIQARGGSWVGVNRTNADNADSMARTASSITVMEIAQ